MNALALLLLRITLGLMLVQWGFSTLNRGDYIVGDQYQHYAGLVAHSEDAILLHYGEIVLGLMVIIGAVRIVTYPLLFIAFFIAAMGDVNCLINQLLPAFPACRQDPSALYPSAVVLAATLLLIASIRADKFAIDRKIFITQPT